MVLGGTPFIMTSVADNLARIQSRIAAAAVRSGRRPDDITLIAVTKYVDSSAARQLIAAGCRDLGESRPQDLWAKAAALAEDAGVGVPPLGGPQPHEDGTPTIRWHL